ncbi:MAG: hypothetical protein DRJ03_14500 [Chloroflexi bacterium]|nr:MAG: hypothetical protein DRJ03_14500 [Chloroflexota bacterium]
MKVYKFVLPSHNYYVSVVAAGKAEVKYFPGKWVKAPFWLRRRGYHLTAFKDLETAEKYTNVFSSRAELWEAEAEGVITELPPPLLQWRLARGFICRGANTWPEGTVMAKRLRLVKLIKKIKKV